MIAYMCGGVACAVLRVDTQHCATRECAVGPCVLGPCAQYAATQHKQQERAPTLKQSNDELWWYVLVVLLSCYCCDCWELVGVIVCVVFVKQSKN